MNVASLMSVVSGRMKSSAVSVWIRPGLGGRDNVPIFPSGSPVEKEKGAAEACAASRNKVIKVQPKTGAAVLAIFVRTEHGFAEVGIWRLRPSMG